MRPINSYAAAGVMLLRKQRESGELQPEQGSLMLFKIPELR